MPTNRRILSQDAAVSAGDADAAEGLVLHLDANDEDSIEAGGANQGNGSGTWFDIANHDLNVPLADKASNLQFHLNFSDTNSYAGTGTIFNDISGNNITITPNGNVAASDFAQDLGGYFNVKQSTGEVWTIPHSNDTHLSSTNGFTYEFWLYFDTTGNDTHQFYLKGTNDSNFDTFFDLHEGNGWVFRVGGISSNFTHNADKLLDQYVHVAFTMSTPTNPVQKLYLNGTLVKTVSASGTVTNTSSYNTNIGAVIGNNNDIYGRLGAVRLYNTALTASEVAQNFRHGRNFSYSSIYSTNLAIHLDAADDTTVSATTWSDKANSNNATIGSSVGFSGTLSDYYDKELGNWLVLDGSDDNMTIASNSSFQNATAFTVEMWIEPISIGDNEMLSTLYTGGSDYKWDLRFNSASGDIRWGVADSSGAFASSQDITTTDTLSTGNWHHLIATYDDSANTQKIFINGLEVKAASSPTAGTRTGGSDDIDIGHRVGSFEANIKIGQYRLYNTSLTSAQVAQNYLATKNDYPNGNHATNNGATFATNGSSPNEKYFDFVSNDYFETSVTKNWASIPFSVEMWFNTDSRNSEYLWGLNDTVGNGVGASIRGSGNGFQLMFLGSGVIVSAGVVNTSEWYQLVFTSDGTTKKAYLNGSFVASGTTTISSSANNKAFTLGRYGTANAGYYDGKIGLVRLFDKELTASEVTANYDADKATYGLS